MQITTVTAGLTLGSLLAFASLVQPERAAVEIGISFESRAGRTDFQGIYGGFLLTLYGYALTTQNQGCTQMLAYGWTSITIVRMLSMIPKTRRGYAQWRALIVEAFITGLLSPAFWYSIPN